MPLKGFRFLRYNIVHYPLSAVSAVMIGLYSACLAFAKLLENL